MWMEKHKMNDREYYTGEVGYANLPDGKGKLYEYGTDRLVYEGWFRNGKFFGQGTYYTAEGQVQSGEYKNGRRHGHFKVTDSEGPVFEGEFVNGIRSGIGTLFFRDGHRLEVNWVNDKAHGHGREIWPNGDVFEGEWLENDVTGKGTFFRSNGVIEEVEVLEGGEYKVLNRYQKVADTSKTETAPEVRENLPKEELPVPAFDAADADKYLTVAETTGNDNCSAEVAQYFSGIVGMAGVKKQLDSIYKRFKIDALRTQKLGVSAGKKGYYFIITGNPGTGKTTVARIIGTMLYNTGVLPANTFVEVDRSGLVGEYIGATAQKTTKAIDSARGGTLFIDEAYSLFRKDNERDFGTEAIETLLKDMEDHRGEYCVVMAGYKEPMQEMMKYANQGLASRFDYQIEIPDYSEEELLDILVTMAAKQHFRIKKEARQVILHQIKKEKVDSTFDNARYARRLLDRAIEHQADRLSSRIEDITEKDLQELYPEDFGTIETDADSLENSLAKLDNLIGLDNVKASVHALADYMAVQIESEKRGLATAGGSISMNMVFTGSPGTGKTTVARLVGEIYYHLGLLKRKDVFVECTRADLVGRFQGETALRVKAAVQSAMGGILFIDEAYSLVNGEGDSFGMEAVTPLVAEIENNRENLAVILAGYTDNINDFLATNPGLKSRFSNYLEFKDYDREALSGIFNYEMTKRGYLLDISKEKLNPLIERRSAEPDFGNARGIRNLCDEVVMNHNSNLKRYDLRTVSDEVLMTITNADLPDR